MLKRSYTSLIQIWAMHIFHSLDIQDRKAEQPKAEGQITFLYNGTSKPQPPGKKDGDGTTAAFLCIQLSQRLAPDHYFQCLSPHTVSQLEASFPPHHSIHYSSSTRLFGYLVKFIIEKIHPIFICLLKNSLAESCCIRVI